ncbi:1-acyl-sn-glycerol-3-phosphate acyltransferase [Sinorhizobium terangae]|nr:1-acyl-sn-glycerol-3-phosphate acyltransferase [Sinorhizobium terangae]
MFKGTKKHPAGEFGAKTGAIFVDRQQPVRILREKVEEPFDLGRVGHVTAIG